MTLHHCGGDHQGQILAEAQCNFEAAIRDHLIEYARALDQPPPAPQITDLWAHARQMHDDGATAARWVRQVLDLGWRPTVGAS
ncbi:hypothetical protein [Nocardioides sp. YIM 152315]|uniref:hypothetical protein n=1 Tax=Nocardioides sp. YIM 152315 TaxID=3031760 RepID=UPI0023DB037B|nr:hypothetical protein [Nocardioides sp. YIM 152315]MDF1603374.1 hypothetical protein [Nocardioides sp. YIM 152315]